jgi:hypothetical protein
MYKASGLLLYCVCTRPVLRYPCRRLYWKVTNYGLGSGLWSRTRGVSWGSLYHCVFMAMWQEMETALYCHSRPLTVVNLAFFASRYHNCFFSGVNQNGERASRPGDVSSGMLHEFCLFTAVKAGLGIWFIDSLMLNLPTIDFSTCC